MYINLSREQGICILSLNRPGTNSLQQDLLDELYAAITGISHDEAVKAVILTSSLPFGFSSGLDLGSFQGTHAAFAKNVYRAVYKTFQIVQSITACPKIYIAALAGPVIGSGSSIALACDLRIAAVGTWFWLPDPQYGGLLGDGGLVRLAQITGIGRAAMLALTNERINLDTADKWGLIYKTAPREILMETALTAAARLCGLSPKTLEHHKKILNQTMQLHFPGKALRKLLHSPETSRRFQFYIKQK